MITLTDINKTIIQTIKKSIYQTPIVAEFCAEDLKKPVVRPSLKVILEKNCTNKFNSCSVEKTLQYRVYFFASDGIKPKSENFRMQEILSTIFLDGLLINDSFYIPIKDIEFVVSDGVLICTIELYYIELLTMEQGEVMEELEMTMKEVKVYGSEIAKY